MADGSDEGLASRRFLVVEDDALVALQLVSYLEGLGGSVTWATNVHEAMHFLEVDAKIDVAIVDMNLGGEMSTPVLDELLRMNVFTILCTGYEAMSLEERFQILPRSEKPFTRAKIRSLMAPGL